MDHNEFQKLTSLKFGNYIIQQHLQQRLFKPRTPAEIQQLANMLEQEKEAIGRGDLVRAQILRSVIDQM